LGRSMKSFEAFLLPEFVDELLLDGGNQAEMLPFASVTSEVLEGLGGKYADLAEQLKRVPVESIEVTEATVLLPPLLDFEFDVAEFVETEEVASVSARPLQQVPHEFEVATIEVQTKQEQQEQQELEPPNIVIRREAKQDWQYVESLAEDLTLELVKIPAGNFVMGSSENELESYGDERPQQEVTVSEFYMGKYPVTQMQWRFVANLPEVEGSLDPNPSNFKGDNLPVERVSWLNAVEFCTRLSQHTGREYRLPSEAEWEYACRAGTTTPFHFGETISSKVANYNATSAYGRGSTGEYRRQTTPVGSFQVANNFGLYDMHGNVREWCQDYWHGSYGKAPVDKSAWIDSNASKSAQNLLRGGSWGLNPHGCRSASRLSIDASNRINSVGLRLVFSARILP